MEREIYFDPTDQVLTPPEPNIEQQERVSELALTIPDRAVISSQLSLSRQELYVDKEEFKDYIAWIQQFLPDHKELTEKVITLLVKKASLLTKNNLKATHEQQWEEFSQDGNLHSLTECISQEMCTCFHRATFFNLLMNEVGIPCTIMEGKVIETDIEKLDGDPKVLPLLDRYALQLSEHDFEEPHLWNLVLATNHHQLVDTAFLYDNQPIVASVDSNDESRNTFSIPLPNGKFRHYLSQGLVNVEPSSAS